MSRSEVVGLTRDPRGHCNFPFYLKGTLFITLPESCPLFYTILLVQRALHSLCDHRATPSPVCEYADVVVACDIRLRSPSPPRTSLASSRRCLEPLLCLCSPPTFEYEELRFIAASTPTPIRVNAARIRLAGGRARCSSALSVEYHDAELTVDGMCSKFRSLSLSSRSPFPSPSRSRSRCSSGRVVSLDSNDGVGDPSPDPES